MPENGSDVGGELVSVGQDDLRDELESVVTACAVRHRERLRSLDELQLAHAQLREELALELENSPVPKETTLGSKLKRLFRRERPRRERPLHMLLTEKVEIAQRRTQQVGNYLDRITLQISALEGDMARLREKSMEAKERSLLLASEVAKSQEELAILESERVDAPLGSSRDEGIDRRVEDLQHKIWQEGASLRLYATADSRLSKIGGMNKHFMEILRNLHGNMQLLYEAANEVLSELEGSLSALAGAAKATELSLDLYEAMASLRVTANKVVVLASETSLYLTRNVDNLAEELRIFDDTTEQFVSHNLRAERAEFQASQVPLLVAAAKKLGPRRSE